MAVENDHRRWEKHKAGRHPRGSWLDGGVDGLEGRKASQRTRLDRQYQTCMAYFCCTHRKIQLITSWVPFVVSLQADDAGLADTKDKEKAERAPVGPHHVLRWFGEVATHVKTQVDKVGLVNSLAPCGLVVSPCAFFRNLGLLHVHCLRVCCVANAHVCSVFLVLVFFLCACV